MRPGSQHCPAYCRTNLHIILCSVADPFNFDMDPDPRFVIYGVKIYVR